MPHKNSLEKWREREIRRQQKSFARKHILTVSYQDYLLSEIACTQDALELTQKQLQLHFEYVLPEATSCYEPGEIFVDSLGRGTFQKGKGRWLLNE